MANHLPVFHGLLGQKTNHMYKSACLCGWNYIEPGARAVYWPAGQYRPIRAAFDPERLPTILLCENERKHVDPSPYLQAPTPCELHPESLYMFHPKTTAFSAHNTNWRLNPRSASCDTWIQKAFGNRQTIDYTLWHNTFFHWRFNLYMFVKRGIVLITML